jgi:hypothetical protein
MSMQTSTLEALEDSYAKFPGMRAEGALQAEIDAAAAQLGVPFPASYQEFLLRYGGGHAGSLSVAGLRRWEFASRGDWSVIELTNQHRAHHSPSGKRWVIFSDDGFGNPIGFDECGRVWISDHNSCEFVCLESSFEDWVRRWALRIEPHRRGYVAQEKWPDEMLQRLRKGPS